MTLRCVAIEAGLPRNGLTAGTPVLATDEYGLNPLDGRHFSLEYLKELEEDGNIQSLPTPIVIPDKYDGEFWMTLQIHEHDTFNGLQLYSIPSDVKTDIIEHWTDDKFAYTLFETDEGRDNYCETVVNRTIRKVIRGQGKDFDEDLVEGCLLIHPHHPVANALWVKTSTPDKFENYDQIARACLRGREAEYEIELANPQNWKHR